MAAMSDYPIMLDGTALPFARGWSEDWGDIEDVNTSEAGTDLVVVTRIGRLTLGLKYRLMGSWDTLFQAKKQQRNIVVSLFNPDLGEYETRNMRLRGYKKVLVEESENCDESVKGMWDYSFNLIEF